MTDRHAPHGPMGDEDDTIAEKSAGPNNSTRHPLWAAADCLSRTRTLPSLTVSTTLISRLFCAALMAWAD
jgi:hypothetical protein